ncbi:hypothetical protein [Silvimonas iriomotensis]|uniref:Regulatory protein RecX n=1 Tax=Silvimonas iriomotensis TaxID=449662 RepID=A0ABQ2P9N9_9NEIS|nr:hypothetical protein [Silvimonas iriomotensis]GGP21724.1 hypothetical protein GCM10010970_21900 [Silvimonas iriomotensis]
MKEKARSTDAEAAAQSRIALAELFGDHVPHSAAPAAQATARAQSEPDSVLARKKAREDDINARTDLLRRKREAREQILARVAAAGFTPEEVMSIAAQLPE